MLFEYSSVAVALIHWALIYISAPLRKEYGIVMIDTYVYSNPCYVAKMV